MTGGFFGYTCIDSVLTIVYHSTHRCKQKRGKGIVDSEPFRERSRQELEGSAGRTCRSRPGVVELKAEALDSAGHSRYLFKCRSDEREASGFSKHGRNKGGTTEARAFRPLRRKAFICLSPFLRRGSLSLRRRAGETGVKKAAALLQMNSLRSYGKAENSKQTTIMYTWRLQ